MKGDWTAGPWIFYADLPSAEPNWHIVTTANKMRVLANVHIEPGNAMDEANARLIAAAPDLFDALESAVFGDLGWVIKARSALASARGETPPPVGGGAL